MFLVRLHVIQFTRYSFQLFAHAVSSLILSHPTAFVKNFFQVFSKFFVVCFCMFAVSQQLNHISTFRFTCQELFSFLFKFLFGFALFCCSREQLGYITTSPSVCQVLFSLFLIFFILRMKMTVTVLFMLQTTAQDPSLTRYHAQI